jgi:hypothetical protein
MEELVDVNNRDFRLEWHITDTGLYAYRKRYSCDKKKSAFG